VVGASIGGIPEMVVDGVTGKLHLSGDAASLRDALLWMTGPSADLPSMGREARRRIEEEYSVDQHLAKLLAIYQEVAA
jgi:glycosyltransferase involved in cell wall biosynthesis